MLGYDQIVLVLLLKQLFVDLGDVLRDDLCVRVRGRGRHRLEVVERRRSFSVGGSLASGAHILVVLLVGILNGLSNLILRVAAGT